MNDTEDLGSLHPTNGHEPVGPARPEDDPSALTWLYAKLAARGAPSADDRAFLEAYASV